VGAGGNSRQFPAEPGLPVPQIWASQLEKKEWERSLRALRASGMLPFNSNPPHSTHATRRYLSFRSTVVYCCMRGFSALCGVGGGAAGASSPPGLVIGPWPITKPFQEETNRPENSAFPLLHLTPRATTGFQGSFSARDHLNWPSSTCRLQDGTRW
jgi:hypothetical protein